MRFLVLGPLQAIDDGGSLALGGPKQQLVLAVLLSNADTMVSTDRLIDEVWGDRPPPTARRTLQGYVSKLGRVLGDGRIEQRGSGYFLTTDGATLDAHEFEDLVRGARSGLSHDPAGASAELERALALWRGSPYEGLADEAPSLQADVVRLEEVRLAATEDRVEAQIRSGSDADLVAELENLSAQYPLRERLRFLHMLALYRSGRQAEALRVFEDVRSTLVSELGLDPSPLLVQLETRVLEHDPALRTNSVFTTAQPDRADAARNPYKGLRPFGEADADDFFGRNDLVRQVEERLAGRGPTSRMVVLAGPSGSGKSSVVRAGVIPQIRQGTVADSAAWRVVDMFPGADPFAQLAAVLGSADGVPIAELAERLRGTKRIPGDATSGTTLLLVDQCEELFTIPSGAADAEDFLDLLVAEAEDDRSGIRTLLVLRADFLDEALLHQGLGRLMSSVLVLVPPLADHDVRAAITEPAMRVGVRVDAELTAELTRDVHARSSALPLLQYSLTDLFDRRQGDALTVADYRAGGGLLGALAKRATEVLDVLSDAEREAARQLFLRLVTVTDEAEHLRRRATRAELAELPVDHAALEEVLQRLVDHRLITFDRDRATGEGTVEVAHESLLRELPLLRTWLEQHHEDLDLRRRLDAAAQEWRAADRGESFLLVGARLAGFEEWMDRTDLLLTIDERAYLDASIAAERNRRTADAERIAREDRLQRRSVVFRRVALASVVVGLLVSALAAFALGERSRAESLAAEAAASDEARRLIALANGSDDRELAVLLAIEAVAVTEPPLPEAIGALRTAIRLNPFLYTVDGFDGTFSPDGRTLATTLNGGEVALWDAATGTELRRIPGHPPATTAIGFSHDGTVLFTAGSDGIARAWDVRSTGLMQTFEGHEGPVDDIAPGADGQRLATAARDGTVRVWDVASGAQVALFTRQFREAPEGFGCVFGTAPRGTDMPCYTEGTALSVAWGPDDAYLLTGDTGGDVTEWDVGAGRERVVHTVLPGRMVWDVVVLSDETISAGLESVVRTDRATGRTSATSAQLVSDRTVTDLAYDPWTGTIVGFGSERVTGWDIDTGTVLFTHVVTKGGPVAPTLGDIGVGATRVVLSVPAQSDVFDVAPLGAAELLSLTTSQRQVTAAAVSPDGRLLVTSGIDLVLWGADDLVGRPVALPAGGVANPLFSSSGRWVALSRAGPSGVWDTETGGQVMQLPGSAVATFEVVFTPDEATVMRATPAGRIEVYDVATGVLEVEIDSGQGLVRRIASSPDGDVIASAGTDGTVRTFSLVDGAPVQVLEGHEGAVFDADISPDGSLIASAGSDGLAFIWEAATGRTVAALEHFGAVNDVGFSPTDGVVATVGADGLVNVWTMSGDRVRTLAAHTGARARRLAFSADGSRIAGIGADTVTVWDMATGNELLAVVDHTAVSDSGAFSADGDRLLAVGSDGVARVFALDTDELIQIARSRVTRVLSEEECIEYGVDCALG